jgi:NADH-quinone oxidoreductase subunit L
VEYALLLTLLIPLVSSIFLMGFSLRISERVVRIVGCSSILASFLLLVVLFLFDGDSIGSHHYVDWIAIPLFHAPFTLHLDHVSQWMGLIITGVGFLIHVYSIGYMEEESALARYFACMNFFIFSMLLLVLADNLLLLFMGWEGVGAASYFLIGFWHQKKSAEQAAKKAFMINRIGDFGLLMGILLLLVSFGTLEIPELLKKATDGGSLLTLATLLLFVGAVGKSAQLPLHSWLPDAMEGPTPVSALIHAATMVTAGVYLVVRMHPLFLLTPLTLTIVGWIGVLTALYAALTAVGQNDLKRVLAYSTMSQLGLMFVACGAGAFYAAMFHLTTHAFIKALLFLSAGNVLHGLHGENDMRKMGGLKKFLPQTNTLFLLGILALSGIPPLAAFFSKDLILAVEFSSGYYLLYGIGLAASLLTAFYLTRAYCMTFWGMAKAKEAHESPRIMLYPIYVLAFLSLTGGLLGFSPHRLPFLEEYLKGLGLLDAEKGFSDEFLLSPETWIAFFLSALSILLAWRLYSKQEREAIPLFAQGFYLDTIGRAVFSKPAQWSALWIRESVEPTIVEGSLLASVGGVSFISKQLQRLQNGQIRSYVAWFAVGFALLLFYLRITHV